MESLCPDVRLIKRFTLFSIGLCKILKSEIRIRFSHKFAKLEAQYLKITSVSGNK